jgi:WhiB family redox-sensing transcriptional regulator
LLGACGISDLQLFFVPDGVPAPERYRREQAAKKICAGCVVQVACLRYALDAGEPCGVWGGMTAAERSRHPERASSPRLRRL